MWGILRRDHLRGAQPPRSTFPEYEGGYLKSPEGAFACGLSDHRHTDLYQDSQVLAVFTGRIFNRRELLSRVGEASADSNGALAARLFMNQGQDFVKTVNGAFALAVWDKKKRELLVARDHLGVEPLYICITDNLLAFSSSIASLLHAAGLERRLNFDALSRFLLFNYIPGEETIFQGIRKLRPAHLYMANGSGVRHECYWRPPFDQVSTDSPQDIAAELRHRLRKAVDLRLEHHDQGVFLSGGLDSSTVLALASEKTRVSTFSYRCRQDSFDEAKYARVMADHAGTAHQEIDFGEQDVLIMPEIVGLMDEPFCDLGINIASFLLGREAARHQVAQVLTGDGGDELFAGHPVYEADKIAYYIDRMPEFIKNSFIRMALCLPDSDKKKNWMVKARRFAENVNLPAGLLTNRWRVYYHPEELPRLLHSSAERSLRNGTLFSEFLKLGDEVKADFLGHCLYADYQTTVDFYLRRNDLNRSFGIETRFPLLDYTLVEYCARIPAALKIKKWFETKYILKEAAKDILPPEILYRKDKLGHSIPMKNWLRNGKSVKGFILDYLSDATRKREMFQSRYIDKMIEDHMSRRRNNSHRLWGLAVLEMWLQQHYDQASVRYRPSDAAREGSGRGVNAGTAAAGP